MACSEPMDSDFSLPGLLRNDRACDPDAGCCVVGRPWEVMACETSPTGACCIDLAFNKAAFARASPLAVRRILTLVPLAWAVALSLRRMALRRATLREDGGASWWWTPPLAPR